VIVVDSSVWIDYFRGISTPEVQRLKLLQTTDVLVTGDLIVVEILQGIQDDTEFDLVKATLESLIVVHFGGLEIAIEAARNYRELRSLGITVRKTIDSIIATFCISHGHDLLYSDRDFDPFVQHLGLRSAMQSGRLPNPGP
jgi:predicted nucleic acid-binding protein